MNNLSGKRTKEVTIFLLLILTALFVCPVQAEEINRETGIFRSAFVKIDGLGTVTALDESKPVSASELKENLKIFIQPIKNVYMYLILSSPDHEFDLLFPEQFSLFDRDNILFNKYYIPGDGRFDRFMTVKGTYVLYFLVSTKRLYELEKAMSRYRTCREGPESPKKQSTRKQLFDRISLTIGESLLGSPVNKKPVPIIGTIRSEERRIDEAAFEYIFTNIYSRIITIEYQ